MKSARRRWDESAIDKLQIEVKTVEPKFHLPVRECFNIGKSREPMQRWSRRGEEPKPFCRSLFQLTRQPAPGSNQASFSFFFFWFWLFGNSISSPGKSPIDYQDVAYPILHLVSTLSPKFYTPRHVRLIRLFLSRKLFTPTQRLSDGPCLNACLRD